MNPYGQKRPRLEYENDLCGTSEHSQHFTGTVNGFTTHPASFEHQSIPFTSAGGEVISTGSGVFVPQFVVSSAEASLGLAAHQSSAPIVYTQAPSQPGMVLNGIHSLPQGMRPVPGVLERIQTKQPNPNGDIQELSYLRGHVEPMVPPTPVGFPSLLSYEDTENRYVNDTVPPLPHSMFSHAHINPTDSL